MDVLESSGDLQQQVLQLQLRQVAEPPVVLGDDVGQRAAAAVLVLDEHVVVLGPGRVVAHHVGVLAQHGVGVHFPQGVLSVGRENVTSALRKIKTHSFTAGDKNSSKHIQDSHFVAQNVPINLSSDQNY